MSAQMQKEIITPVKKKQQKKKKATKKKKPATPKVGSAIRFEDMDVPPLLLALKARNLDVVGTKAGG
jgi:hypothetical protein